MLKAFDTSVLVAALSAAHGVHDVARPHLDDALEGRTRMAVSAHALAETYATLTVLQVRPRITPGQALHLIEENVLQVARVVALDANDYAAALQRMTRLGLVSGSVYDALHIVAAENAEADELLTFNGRDFRRMPPKDPTRLVVL